ncbi:response regulator [Candidatus Saccharibacteria bacterium]|nr:response regulator [Candidatus Saccharibacteria bacterium]
MSKIMVVEDDASLREIYSIRITAEGYEVVSAGDGEEALAVAVREKPDLILADVMMPKISGFDMLDILRSTPEVANIKVIMMTALSGDNQRERGERLGADRYLVKSQIGIEDMVNTIHEVLGDKGGSATPANNPVSANPNTPVDMPSPAAAVTSPSVATPETPANPIPTPITTPPTVPPTPEAPTTSESVSSTQPTPEPISVSPVAAESPSPLQSIPQPQPFTLNGAANPAPKNWSLRPTPEAPNGQPGQAQ